MDTLSRVALCIPPFLLYHLLLTKPEEAVSLWAQVSCALIVFSDCGNNNRQVKANAADRVLVTE